MTALDRYPTYCTVCDGPCVEPETFPEPVAEPWAIRRDVAYSYTTAEGGEDR